MAQQIQSVYTLIALHWYKNTLNTNPSSSIPWTPAWPPPFSCAAALHTLLSLSSFPTPSDPHPPLEPRVSRRPPPPPEPSLICSLSLPTPSDPPMSPHSTRRRSSPASSRWHRCQRSFVSWRRWRRPCLTTACGGRCAWRTDPATASSPSRTRSSMDLRQSTSPTSGSASDISGGSPLLCPRSTPCILVPLFPPSSPLFAILSSVCFSSISCRP